MDIDKLILREIDLLKIFCFSSLMDIDKLIQIVLYLLLDFSFSSLMDIDKLIQISTASLPVRVLVL